MHFFNVLAGAAVLAASAAAQSLAFTSAPTNVEEDTPVTFTWVSADPAPVTITLMKGPTDDLQSVLVITSDATGGSYTWSAGDNLVSDTDYAFEISQGSATNYWGPVVLNSGLEPGSPSTPVVTPAPAPYTTTPVVVPPVTVTTPPPPPVITPPTNVTTPGVPTPTPFNGASAIGVSFTGIVAIFASFAFFL